MIVKELAKKCDEWIKLGIGDHEVMFDTDAMCFDVHLVKVVSADYEKEYCEAVGGHRFVILGYGTDEPHHFNTEETPQ